MLTPPGAAASSPKHPLSACHDSQLLVWRGRTAAVQALGMLCLACTGSSSPPEKLRIPLSMLHTAASLDAGPTRVAALHALGDCACLWYAAAWRRSHPAPVLPL